ncbi:MAG: AAA family ATPase [Candidatus Omnitrophota bacterium]|nr:MAG: AAA family ATPase [Candidatus Omnitrophota bacterium]
MYLRELEIFGFKSFPEKTTLKFEPGTTVVVGPNGCGKSNVLDAIKWSLGEQSPKSLRGTKMEDIIFNGTEQHPPLNYAEVSLTFCNEDNYLPIKYKEVSVGRRLYRSGESQYFINKNPVRLKDVEELFMGTGIGESTYSFIEQGRIEIFLSYKPEDKRLIFDEASGIVKYKERKRETMRRLQEADENLLRLEDILSEIKRQIRYLERQVEKARKFKEAQAKLVEVEKKIAAFEFRALEDRSDSFLEELNKLKDQRQNKESQLKEAKDKWDDSNRRLRELRRELEETNEKVASLNAKVESSTSHIQLYEQRIRELGERNIAIEQIKKNLGDRLATQSVRLEEEKREFGTIEERVGKVGQETKSLEEEKTRRAEEIKLAKKKIDEEKAKIYDLETQKTKGNNSLIEIQANLNSFLRRKQRLLLDKAKIEGLIKEKKESIERTEEELGDVESNLGVLRQRKERLLANQKELISRKEEFKNKLIEKEKELVELNSYYEFLKDLRIKYEVFPATKRVTILLDEDPGSINKLVLSVKDVKFEQEGRMYKATLDAKVISLEEKELGERIRTTQNEIDKYKDNLQLIDRELEVVAKEMGSQLAALEEEESNLRQRLQEKENLSQECERFKEEFELVEKELHTALQGILSLEKEQKEKEEQGLFIEQNLSQVNQSLVSFQKTVMDDSERITEIDIEVARKQAQRQSLYKEQETLHTKLSFLEEEKNNIINNINEIEQVKEHNVSRSQSLAAQIQDMHKKISEGKKKIEEDTQKKGRLQDLETSIDENMQKMRESTQDLDEENEKAKSKIYDKQLEMQDLDHQKQKLKDYLRQVYQIEFDLTGVGIEGDNLGNLTAEKEKLFKRKQSLGEVNLIAIEEFEELKKREEFMENQKQDLITSKDNLKKAILKINRTSRELFLDTFAKVEEEFKKNFRFLFNGGRARLVLLDPNNVLESGVEIEVQPPGKKLQNVSLLSGGEKALTAISLIFAIFRVNPSPFCVLDEIDAPLDEANVDRFNHILKEFSSFSQFLLISHNKKTMSNADVLYGVTMQEKGVSKLVSVKFAAGEPAPA